MRIADSPEYRAALEFLYDFVDYERSQDWSYDGDHFELERVRRLLERLGNPHRHGWYVHIAGTNGKGSVAAMVATALTASGIRAGLNTSPHLMTFRERIRIDGVMLAAADVLVGVDRLRKAVNPAEGATFFDVWTALAFDHFARHDVEAAVVEVGMGGRLDSTNVITPAVSVITSVSLDHRGRLGDTVAEIAAEKAGIIKPGVPVVSAPQSPEVLRVIADTAVRLGSPLTVVGEDVTFSHSERGFDYRGRSWRFSDLLLLLPGRMQWENAAVALAALEILAGQYDTITPESARRGVETVRWPGRLETIAHNPTIIVDGACNSAAMEVVRDHIRGIAPSSTVVAVLGMCGDKEVESVAPVLREAADRIVFTHADVPRALSPEKLAERAEKKPGDRLIAEPLDAVATAVDLAGPDGLVLVTGSLYLLGVVMRHFKPGVVDGEPLNG